MVTPIDTATSTAGKPIKVGDMPLVIAFNLDGKAAYVTNTESGHGDADHNRHQHRGHADPGRQLPYGHRDRSLTHRLAGVAMAPPAHWFLRRSHGGWQERAC